MNKSSFKPILLGLLLTSLFAASAIATPTARSTIEKRHGSHSESEKRDGEASGLEVCSSIGVDDWSSKAQLISLFCVLASGGFGAFIPILSYRYKALRLPPRLIDLGKFFSIGVILSTAIIHIYPPANSYLNDACVAGKLGNYEGWPGVIFMFAIFVMQFTEFILTSTLVKQKEIATGNGVKDLSSSEINYTVHTHHNHVHGGMFSDSESRKKLSTYLLEASVAFHSITVGLSLGMTSRAETITLGIAVCFHQMFEGFAIGDRLTRLYSEKQPDQESLSPDSRSEVIGKVKVMLAGASIYMFATPIGQGIGMGIHSVLAPRSPAYLICLGVLEALSAGILVYIALVNLISEEFSSIKFKNYSTSIKAWCFFAMYLGAGVMALIGKWA
ncbi:hypothetical protein BB559_006848 [Furculomyces boomerangus]|uniref:Zinc/iron permease n=2 Tax=Harpellales TaxID=61421 RepID=A0A2T9Y092_9FUNG|nr:hypothetical protein BB559_006848 [Furculomyces boomerangus]PVZ97997.1 hypothetical protein BB558_006020 [Smittium angustum]